MVSTQKKGGSAKSTKSTDSTAGPGPDAATLVVVGASIGSRDALAAFLSSVRPDGAAYIVCVQLQDAIEDRQLVSEIGGWTELPVALARDTDAIERGHVYVVPQAMLATIARSRIKLRGSPEPIGERGRIDSLMLSVAGETGERCVGVILAGTGGDGTLGVAAIKEQGGLTIAQELDETHRASVNSAGTASAIADYVLRPEKIGECIDDYERHLAALHQLRGPDEIRGEVAADLSRIVAILRNKTGHDFHGYKQNTFLRRVQRRMQVTRSDRIDSYIAFLRDDADEAQNLFNDLLIGVTAFFRDKGEFELLEREVVPKLFEGKTAADQLRVWVLGCATGEEAYSIAMLLREHMASLDVVPQVQIFATDIDGRSLASARVGRYADTVVKDVSPERLARWFVKEGDTYCVVKDLREMCIFSQHSVIKDAPFSRLDLISCRNLLIYLNNDLQNRVIPLFHFALRPGGFLFLGNSENVTRHSKLFAPVDRRYRIFRRQESNTRVLPDFPLTAIAHRRPAERLVTGQARTMEVNIARRAERLAERYAPAYVVIDSQHEVLHFSGRTGAYLDPATGTASLALMNLLHRDLRMDVHAALHKAETEGRTVVADRVRMGLNGDAQIVTIIVEPIENEHEAKSYVVLFQHGDRTGGEEVGAAVPPPLRDEHVQRLEAELRLTRERLQATIEELESTNEELKSSNEEYQSINEELQSANEELETSKEELQSVNEELQTVNGELSHRVQDLGRANSDLKNLLESTQIATIFLDNDLRIKNFTPAVADIFHVIEGDLGRPITHIAGHLSYPDLEEDVRKVLRTLHTIDRELDHPKTGGRYLVRVLPYRSIDNFIAGVVLTFLDVSAAAKAERALKDSEERYRAFVHATSNSLFRLSADGSRLVEVWGSLLREHNANVEPNAGWLTEYIHPDDRKDMAGTMAHAFETGTPYELEHRGRRADGGWGWVVSRAVPVRNEAGQIIEWLGTATDISERKQAEEAQQVLISELQHRTRNLLAIVRSLSHQTLRSSRSLEDYNRGFGDRLLALSRVQDLLSQGDGFTVTLEELVKGELEAHGAVVDGRKVLVDGPEVPLSSKAVQVLTLALHELATNAVKYGALRSPDANLSIRWRNMHEDGQHYIMINWSEEGVAYSERLDGKKRGFGRELIERALPYDLGAETKFELADDGVRCEVKIPVRSPLASSR